MPTIHLHLVRPEHGADQLVSTLAQELTRLTAAHLGKRADLTAVLIHWMQASNWFIGGQALSEHAGRPAAQVEIAVTGDTNTAAEKAAWIDAVHSLLRQHLPRLPEVSYAIVRDLPASAWGYGGLTQEARRNAA